MLNGGPDPESLFSPFDLASRKSVVAAVSGGSDSTALLVLLSDWLAVAAPRVRLFAVTVDHGLRPEAAAEAETVAAFCAARGIRHRTMAWTGDKPAAGIAQAARLARYRLLAEAARAIGSDIVLTGHTLDDQIETVEMRRRRGSGRGLAGMAAATLFAGRCWILRPLLATRRQALRETLMLRKIGWTDDPSNTDLRSERARMRIGRTGDAVDVVAAIAAGQANRRALGQAAAALIGSHGDRPAAGLVRLRPEFLSAPDRDAAVYALRILLAVVGGTPQLPDALRTADLYARLADGWRGRATLARCVADRRKAGLFLHRERRDLPVLTLGEGGAEWDGRFRVAGPAGSVVRAAGARDVVQYSAADGVPPSLARAALAAQPVVYRSDEATGSGALGLADALKTPSPTRPSGSTPLPHLVRGEDGRPAWLPSAPPERGRGAERSEAERGPEDTLEMEIRAQVTPILAPWALFLPDFDLAPATAVARLIGADEPPLPPFTGHKDISA